MHDLLQQMGREIIQQESEEPRNRSKIWCYKDAYEVLTRNMVQVLSPYSSFFLIMFCLKFQNCYTFGNYNMKLNSLYTLFN